MADEMTDDGSEAATEPERLYGALVTWSRGQAVLHASRDEYLALITMLRDEGFTMVIDVTAVDYSASEKPRLLASSIAAERYEVVTSLISHARRERVRVRVQVPAGDARIASIFDLFPGAEAMEREVYDMFGIVFDRHPDMNRILMPEDWIGWPLRKDYAIGRIPVQFKGAPAKR